jgi:hypothetical protein
MLDSLQHTLRITFPSVLRSGTITQAIERFADVAHNTYTVVPLVGQFAAGKRGEEVGEADYWREFEERNRPFERIASNWPHYVIPPSHPYTFLDRECPCTFFGSRTYCSAAG